MKTKEKQKSEKKVTPEISIKVSAEKSEDYFYNALCNSMGYFSSYGFRLEYSNSDRQKAEASWNKKNKENGVMCRENVWMEILRTGGKLNFIDVEGDGDNSKTITMATVHKNVSKTPYQHLLNMINENDDAETGDCIIQSVLFNGEIVFG